MVLGGALSSVMSAAQMWTVKDIPDQRGATAIVTGANSGLGYETAKALLAAGASVIMACRNSDRAEAARARLLTDLGAEGAHDRSARLTVELVDLSSLASVGECATRLTDRLDGLDLLINNAGVMATAPQLTEDGIEFQFACNHTGHFALTAALLPLLLDTDGSRVVALSSLAAESGSLVDHDPTTLDGYEAFGHYAATKLANQMFAVELDRRLRAIDATTIAVAAHPGLSGTNLFDGFFGQNAVVNAGARVGAKLVTQPASVGALPTLRAATAPDVVGGSYYGPALPGQFWGPPKRIDVLDHAADPDACRRLWDLSVELTGVDPTPS